MSAHGICDVCGIRPAEVELVTENPERDGVPMVCRPCVVEWGEAEQWVVEAQHNEGGGR